MNNPPATAATRRASLNWRACVQDFLRTLPSLPTVFFNFIIWEVASSSRRTEATVISETPSIAAKRTAFLNYSFRGSGFSALHISAFIICFASFGQFGRRISSKFHFIIGFIYSSPSRSYPSEKTKPRCPCT